MPTRYTIISNEEPVEVEVTDDGDLVFIDHEIEYDISMIEFGEEPSTAYLLWYLWYKNKNWAYEVAVDNITIVLGEQGWYQLEHDARVVLALSFDPERRASIAISAFDFSISERIFIVESIDNSRAIALFLSKYTGKDLIRSQKLQIESMLDPEDKCWLVNNASQYAYSNADLIRLVIDSTDECRLDVLSRMDISYVNEKNIIAAIEDENVLAQALCMVRAMDGHMVTGIAVKRLKDPDARAEVAKYAPMLSDEQRDLLLGRKPNVLR